MTKAILTLIYIHGICSSILAQPFEIGHRQITFTDIDRQGRMIQTEIYYPAIAEGDNTPFAGEDSIRFPLLVFGHGFVMEWGAYANIWNALVTQGYIIAFPRTETGISPDHLTFGQDIAFLVKTIQAEGATAESPFLNRVDSTSCVMGHSMGGGSSFLAIQFNPSITAVVNLAAAETSPSAITACAEIDIPSLLFAGSNDCITPPESNQDLMYESLASACKTLVTIIGASHCQFADPNTLCSFGELTCQPGPDISRDFQHRMTDTLLIPWLDHHLKGNCFAYIEFQKILTSSQDWTFKQACEPCQPVGVMVADKSSSFQIFPMPSRGDFHLINNLDIIAFSLHIYNPKGDSVFSQVINNQMNGAVDIRTGLPPGLYYLEVRYGTRKEMLKMVVQ